MSVIWGFIYLHYHESFKEYDAIKLGATACLYSRRATYKTNEIRPGYFKMVFRVPFAQMMIIERYLQDAFNEYHIYINGGGTEFFQSCISDKIENLLNCLNLKYEKLTQQEINNSIKKYYYSKPNKMKHYDAKMNFKRTIKSFIKLAKTINKTTTIKKYIPRNYQIDIINKSIAYFQQNNKGILALICGLGKTLLSLWIAQKLQVKTILIGVPTIELLYQWKAVIYNIFPNIPCLIIPNTNIVEFLQNNSSAIIITVYKSSKVVQEATRGFTFDLKILDEAHHITSSNLISDSATNIKILEISSLKQLSLTATPKCIDATNTSAIISNDNINHFGIIIDEKSLLWAINNGYICDYNIQTIMTNENDFDEHLLSFNTINKIDKKLFLSAYTALKSIISNNTHHLLVFSNSLVHARQIIIYIEQLIKYKYFNIDNLFHEYYGSDISKRDRDAILNKFEKSEFGIISCVYCLGEGKDIPILDGVMFAENMNAFIRIVQAACRPCRLCDLYPYKNASILIPTIHNDDMDNEDFKIVKDVIKQLGNVDKTVCQKINALNMKICKINVKKGVAGQENIDFGEYNDMATIKLKTYSRKSFNTTYDEAKQIIAQENIKSKKEYYELCERDGRLLKDPETTYKFKFNWIDYLGLKREDYYSLEICKIKVNEYLLQCPEIKKYHMNLLLIVAKICEIDRLFPPNDLWCEIYNIDQLRNLIVIPVTCKKKGLTF